MASANLTAARLRELLHYDPETGVFTRLVWTSSKANVGDEAGSVDDNGYIRICVDRKRYRAHRLAWLYMTGEWPKRLIDHEDTDPGNNRWKNLREANHSTNAQNLRRPHKDGGSGHLGVTWEARRELWSVRIWDGEHNRFVGYFDNAEEGHAAYVEEKRLIHAGNTL